MMNDQPTSTCSPVLVASPSLLDGPDTAPLASVKSTNGASECSEDTGQMFLFGVTCERSRGVTLLHTPTGTANQLSPSMATRDAGSWGLTSSPQGIPASHSLSPGSDWARKMTATYGRRLGDYWLNSDPPDSWVRTLLGTSIWASMTCWLTWKKSATPQGRLLFRLVPSAPRTAGIGSGLLHTPTVTANQESPSMVNRDPGSWRLWGTPTSRDHKDTGDMTNVPVNGLLGRQVLTPERMWPTPAHRDYKGQPSDARETYSLPREVGDTTGKKLNSEWVSRMMGYPDGWLTLDGEAIR